MTWKERLRPASFRGVPFAVEGAGGDGGHRLVAHEYPGSNSPWTEHLGRKVRKWQLNAFLLGDDYDLDLNLLLDALETEDAGTLIHPYFGELTVKVDAFRHQISSKDGRMAKIAITFIEAGKEKYPQSRPNVEVQVSLAAADVALASKDESLLEIQASTQTLQSSKVESEVKSGAVQAAEELKKFPLKRGSEEAADFLEATEELLRAAAEVVFDPSAILDAASDAFLLAYPAIGDGLRAFESLTRIGELFVSQGAGNQAFSDHINGLAIGQSATAASSASWRTFDDATAAQELLTTMIDDASETAADPLFIALQELRSLVVTAVPPEASSLPRLGYLTLPGPLTSLVLAYQVHDDLSREEELVRRNQIQNPAFIPAGRPLEVIVDA